MNRKTLHLRKEQSRDAHPERHQVGSPADETLHKAQAEADPDAQEPRTGKVANDHNKVGEQAPTQRNEGRRTPESRHDRQNIAGGPHNQVTARKGGGGAGRGPNGAG